MEHENEIREIITRTENNIDNSTEQDIKSDMKLLVLSLVEFVATQKPELLYKDTPEEDKFKLFFKLIANSAMEALTANMVIGGKKKMENKYNNLMKIYPLLTKYSAEQSLKIS